MLDGSEHTDTAVNPFAFMYHAYKEGGPFQKLMDETVALENVSVENPSKLCVYADEVVPRKELSHNNKRKQWCMYWSFGELLPYFHLEETWIPILAIRSSTVSAASAGISQVMAKALLLVFGDVGHDTSTCGISLIAKDGTQT